MSLIKLKRMLRLRRIITMLKFKTAYKLAIRIVLTIFTLFLFVHLAACFWFLIVSESENWTAPKDLEAEMDLYTEGVWVRYSTSLYYTTVLMLGLDCMPSSTGETVYATIIVFLGTIVTAALFGQMTVLVQSLNAKSSMYHEVIDNLHQVMDNIKAPNHLQRKVKNYVMRTYWHKDQQEELQKFFEALSPSLRSEVCTQLFKEVLMQNPRLGSSQECVDVLVKRLQAKVCKPEDVLIYIDDVGTEMYLLITGEVSVLGLDSSGMEEHLRKLGASEYFGELSLLTGVRRTATVVAANFCTLAELSKKQFDEIVETFPFIKSRMIAYASERYTEEWKSEIIKVLTRLPYFASCSSVELSQIFYMLQTERYEKGFMLKERNECVDRLTILATGRVSLSMPMKSGEESALIYLNPGSALFISSFLQEKKQAFHVRIMEESCLLTLTADKVRELAETFQSVKIGLDIFEKKDAEEEPIFSDFALPIESRDITETKCPKIRLKSVVFRLIRNSYRKHLNSKETVVAGLLSAFHRYISYKKTETLETMKTPEEALDFLLKKALEATIHLTSTVDRMTKETKIDSNLISFSSKLRK